MLNTYKGENFSYYNGSDPMIKGEEITDFAIGFGLGGKWVTKKGFVFEVNSGIGRNLLNKKAMITTKKALVAVE